MPNLLIHSMSEFAPIIVQTLHHAGASRIAEIGAEYGGMSSILADYAEQSEGHLYSIDPMPKSEFLEWIDGQDHVSHIAKPSLEAFEDLSDIDAWLVDGDHNWFTVYNELKSIDAACQRDGKPLLAILHDVCWPSAFRDSYYAPDNIPPEFRHNYSMDGGAKPGNPGLLPGQGFRGMGQFGMAMHEGGERNGVKKAVLDFIAETERDERALSYAEIPAVFGLGILFDTTAPWVGPVSDLLIPFHQNSLIAKLEENRLANFLTVLDWQDGHIRRPG